MLQLLHSGIERFESWLEANNGSLSFDPYDIWGTRYSLAARDIYYRRPMLGTPLIAPLLALEIVCPSLRKLFAKRDRFATADAQLLLGFINLHRVTGEAKHLEKARQLGEDLLAISIPGYAGHCWGYPFDWQNQRGMWGRNTPFITCTPYGYQAFCALYDETHEERYAEIAQSAARFVFQDLRDTETGPNAAAGSYSPIDDSLVINASAYRAWVLFDAIERFGNEEYREKAQRNVNFILQSQRPDGGWLYAMDPHGNFIDHFHTCFNLKNLWRINRQLDDPEIAKAIERGFEFYRRELFYPDDGLPKPFAIKPRTGLVRLEMYDFAEAITLGALLGDEMPEAKSMAEHLAARLIGDFQLADGHFVTRVYRGGLRHTLPFIRWPQAQLFYALTNLLLLESGKQEGNRKITKG